MVTEGGGVGGREGETGGAGSMDVEARHTAAASTARHTAAAENHEESPVGWFVNRFGRDRCWIVRLLGIARRLLLRAAETERDG